MSPEIVSEAKLEANRANAQLSTGPTSAEGKKRSGKNAFRHGLTGQVALMPDEDREEFTRFCDAIVADYHAEGPIETQLAQSIAEAQGPPDAAPKRRNPPVQPRFGGHDLRVFLKSRGTLLRSDPHHRHPWLRFFNHPNPRRHRP